MSSKQNTDTPHKCRVATCKGRLLEPLENYKTWAYWHGTNSGGWHSKPKAAS